MQTQGSLNEADLASLLETLQVERGTGTLTLDGPGGSCSLYFLFGHLFHANDDNRQGEDVVFDALSWHEGSYRFDPRAKLPPDETIRSTHEQLVTAHRARFAQPVGAGPAPSAAPPQPEPMPPLPPQPEMPPISAQQIPAPPATPPTFEAAPPSYEPPVQAPPEEPVAAAEPVPELVAEADPMVASEAPVEMDPVAAVEPEPASEATPPAAEVEAEPSPVEEVVEPAAAVEAPTTVPTNGYAPTPSSASVGSGSTMASTPVASGAAITPTFTMYPFPSGTKTYEGLKSAFVDFPKLLRTLKNDAHTGYVTLRGDSYAGTILLDGGQLIDAVSSQGNTALQGEQAFQQFRRHMDEGTGTLDVIDLSHETVDAVSQLYSAPYLFIGLLGRFVNFGDLLEYLAEQKTNGALVVQSGGDTGVILLREGSVVGAYTNTSSSLEGNVSAVTSLAANRDSRIDVKAGEGQVTALDVEAALAKPL